MCAVCREAFFLTTSSRDKHQTICLVLSNYYTPPVHSTNRPAAEAAAVTTSAAAAAVAAALPLQNVPTVESSKVPSSLKQNKKTSPTAKCGSGSSSDKSSTTKSLKRKGSSEPSTILKKLQKLQFATSAPPRPSTSFEESTVTPSTPDASVEPTLTWQLKKALHSARDYIIYNKDGKFTDLTPFIEAALNVVKEILSSEIEITRSLKYNLVLEARYEHPEEGLINTRNFKTKSRMLFPETDDIDSQLHSDGLKLLKEEEEAEAEKSGWIFLDIKSLVLRVSKFIYKEPSGSSYVPLPPKLDKRKACVNVVNNDNKCFMYSMLTKHIPNVKPSSMLTEESFEGLLNTYNFDDLQFPVTVNQIKIFEKNNPNVSVNVFEYTNENKVAPLRVVDEKIDHTDLLLLEDKTSNEWHYVFILDFVKLIQKQLTKGSNRIVVCKRCSQSNQRRQCKPNAETWLKEHLKLCGKHKPTEIKLPSEDKNTLQFNQFETQIKVPFVICADMESTLKPVSLDDDEESDGRTYQKHFANSFCTLTTSTYSTDILNKFNISTTPYLYRGQDAGAKFLLHLKEVAEKISKALSSNVPITMTDEERKRHEEAVECDLCHRAFSSLSPDLAKCADHDHLNSRFRSSKCARCNLKCKTPTFIPVWIHNMSNYDQAFIISNLNVLKGCEIRVIPSNTEKMISISVKIDKIWLRFVDSYRMMSASLHELTQNLPHDQLVESSKLVPPEHVQLIRRKGVFPYDYITTEERFLETSLPPKEAFKNKLNDTEITQEDYDHATLVWNSLKFSSLGQYSDFYLKLDTCLLNDTLNSFRSICYEHYKLDLCHFLTAPSLTWQAMLKHTGIILELITDYDMFLMFEASIRGGLVQSSLRYAKANNPLLECPTDYNPDEPTSYLLYLDCVNLYGHSLSSSLPTGNFKWIDNAQTVDWSNLPPDSPFGYVMECDVEVPQNVHDKLNDLPPLPEKRTPPNGKVEKLMSTLMNKQRYIAHYTVFQQAQKLGLRITKVHRVLRFSQSPWMKKYIDFNTNLRSKATNDFSKNFFKLMVNSTFGKSMQNNRRHIDVRVVTTTKAFESYVRQSRFIDRVIINEGEEDGIILIYLRKSTILLDRPIYIGSVTLDVSKVHMYNFFYHILTPCFASTNSKLYLCYIDTDSLIIYVKTCDNVYEVLQKISKEHLDLSNYPDDHFMKDNTNKQVVGKFKDELKGRVLFEHVGLKSKMYSQRFSSVPVTDTTRMNEIKKAKGIKSTYVNKHMRFQHYKDALFNHTEYRAKFNLIRCKKFNLSSVSVEKRSLSFHDDKRHILADDIHTLAHGHFKIEQLVPLEHRRESSQQPLLESK